MIRVEHLTKRYASRTAVDDVSFGVERGEIVGFLGPNGAGKSTTLRMITGYLEPTQGTIAVDGIDALARPLEARRLLGYMPEGVPLYPEMRVHEYLHHRAELKGVARRAIRGAIDRALEQAGVTDAKRRIIGQLSKGYRQRVGLADALVADPPLLILDEPTAGLDPNQIRQVRELVRSFKGSKTVFVSTHILPEVEATCSRIVMIHQGRVVAQGPPTSLRTASAPSQLASVTVRGDAERLRAALATLPAIREIVSFDELRDDTATIVRAKLRLEPGAASLEAVFESVRDAGGVLRELRSESASLEDVFAHLTTDEADAAEERS